MSWLDARIQDLRFSGRLARRSPFLTFTVVATLALGVGLDAGVFAVVDGAVRQPRVQQEPASFAHVQVDMTTRTQRLVGQPFSATSIDYRALRDGATSLADLAAWHVVRTTIEQDATPTLAMLVSCNFFRVYGLEQSVLGRPLITRDCTRSDRLVVISEEVWRTRFHADAGIVGKPISLNGEMASVVGVIPANFSGQLRGPGYWMPLQMQPVFIRDLDLTNDATTPWLALEGRLRPGFTRASAQRELAAIAVQQDRERSGRTTIISLTNGSTLEDPLIGRVAALVEMLTMSGLTLLLVIACSNVVVLLLSRAEMRRREMAIRLSLGAGMTRLLAMLLTEGLFLSCLALPISAYVAYQVPRVAKAMVPMLPYYNMRPSGVAFGYLCLLTSLAGCAAGLAPAAESLRANIWTRTNGRRGLRLFGIHWRMGDALIATQVGISLVLLIGSGLFVQAQFAIRNHDPGFDAEHTLVAPLRVRPAEIPDVLDRARAIPGIRALASAQASPLDVELMATTQIVSGDQQTVDGGRTVTVSAVSPEYFQTLRLPIVRGRSFTRTSVPAEVVISQALARALWPSAESIGQGLRDQSGRMLTVVGVVRDVELLSTRPPMLYVQRAADAPAGVILANVVGSTPAVTQELRQVLSEYGATRVEPRALRSTFDDLASRFSVLVGFVGLLGAVGVAMAITGLYGVVSYVVSHRAKEIGIRMALGATRSVILRLVLSAEIAPVIVGLAFGLFVAWAGTMALAKIWAATPVPIRVDDPATFGTVTATVAATVIAAMSVPAWRATVRRIAEVLRDD